MNSYGGPERRKHMRLNAHFVVSYRIKEPPSDYDLSQTKDVGQGGMFLTTNKKFDKDIQLAMNIRFPFFPKRIEVTGLVVSSKEVVRNLIYETRIKFLDLDERFFRELGEFVKERMK